MKLDAELFHRVHGSLTYNADGLATSNNADFIKDPRFAKAYQAAADTQPWPGELGQRVFENVSAQAWKLWEDRQKMILNEYRLMPWQKEAQELMARHMEDFFFGEGAALPPGYVPQQTK